MFFPSDEEVLRKVNKDFWQKHEVVILHDGNFDGRKTKQHSRCTLFGRIGFRIYF